MKPETYLVCIRLTILQVTCIEKRGTLGGTCLNVGCIPSKALLNNSHLYHQILHDTKNRGIEVGDVKLNLAQLMKSKDTAVSGLTKGVEFLFKKNNVEYIKGTASFTGEHEVKVNLTEGGEQTVVGKNILIATGSESTPFPGLEIDEKRIVSSTGAIALEKVPETMTIIGGGIIGLEMGSVWSRLGAKVTVVEFLGQIGGPGMDAEVAKASQKFLKKQGIEFKLNTKVLGGDASGEKIKLNIEAAKGGKEETVSIYRNRHRALQFTDFLYSWSRMSSLLPLAVDHIQQDLVLRTLESRPTRRAVSLLTRNFAQSYPTSDVSVTQLLDLCLPTRPKRRLLPS